MPRQMPQNAAYFVNKLLIATPAMSDPRFYRAVVLICAHDANGAMGLVVNHKLPGMEFSSLLEQLKITSDIEVKIAAAQPPVLCGGPVEGSRGFLLHDAAYARPETVRIGDAFGVTGTLEALKAVAEGSGPADALFILGYAGWGAGQLERELQDNAWLVVNADRDIIFHAAIESKWNRAIAKLGFDPALLSMTAGRA